MATGFNKYARQLDELARGMFENYRRAQRLVQQTEEHKRKYSDATRTDHNGVTDARYMAERAEAEADYYMACQVLDTAKRQMAEGKAWQQITKLRRDLQSDVEKEMLPNPREVDLAALEILKAGILQPNEYGALMNKAAEASNFTMMRLVGSYAGKAADAREKDLMHGYDKGAQEMRAVAARADALDGSRWLSGFDYLTNVLNRTAANPAMIDDWDSLTAETVENF